MPIKDDSTTPPPRPSRRRGSRTAAKTHNSHTGGKDRPDSHGQTLVDEATEDFQKQDKGGADLVSGMTAVHLKAINDAEEEARVEVVVQRPTQPVKRAGQSRLPKRG